MLSALQKFGPYHVIPMAYFYVDVCSELFTTPEPPGPNLQIGKCLGIFTAKLMNVVDQFSFPRKENV